MLLVGLLQFFTVEVSCHDAFDLGNVVSEHFFDSILEGDSGTRTSTAGPHHH